MNMSGNNLSRYFILNDLHILFTELVSEQETWSHNNDGDGLRSALKALTGIHDTDKSLTAASRDDHLTTASHGQLVECFLLMGAKGDQGVSPVDTNSITPHGVRGRLSVTLLRASNQFS